jgi:hypothetical protein
VVLYQRPLFALPAVAVAAIAGASAIFAAGPADALTAEDLYGCWLDRAAQPIASPPRKAWTHLCFRADGSAHYMTIALPEGGFDDLFSWSISTDDKLVIHGQTCGVQIIVRGGQRLMLLDTCVYKGGWRQLCAIRDETGSMCAKEPGGGEERGQ